MGFMNNRRLDGVPIWDKVPKQVKVSNKNKNIEFLAYKEKVDIITETNKDLIEGIETRGWRTYHIDHKLSIKWGFYNNIEPETIAHPDNLRMLWWQDNWNKGTICFIDDKNSWIVGDLPIFTTKNCHINLKK